MSNVKPQVQLLLKLTWITFKISLYVIKFLATVAMGSKSKYCSLAPGESFALYHEGHISHDDYLNRIS